MKYKYVQLVAYEAPTLKVAINPPQSSNPTHEAVLSLKDPDAQNRVQRLLDVLHWAVETIPYNMLGYTKEPDPLTPDQTETLKVFIAPEFYFRGSAGGYSWNTMLNILECLKLSLTDWRFDDWLIVPGTIISHQDSHPTPKDGVIHQPPFFNTASLIRGGRNSAITFVHKERKSDIDGLPTYMAEGTEEPRFNLGLWKERKERLFEFDGITFGLDVCLDHLSRALKRTVLEWPNHENGVSAPSIDVHLMTSCGMQVKHRGVAARTGGCVLMCDGTILTHDPDTKQPWDHSAVFEVVQHGITDLNYQATLRRVDEIWRRPVPPSCVIPQPAIANSWSAQEVAVYPAVKLV